MRPKNNSQTIISNIMAFDPTVPVETSGTTLFAKFPGLLPRLLVENLRNHGAKVTACHFFDAGTLVTWESKGEGKSL